MHYEDLFGGDILFRAVFENAGVGVVLVDAEGKIARANPAYLRMLGYGDELVGHSYEAITHPDDVSRCGKEFGDFLGSGDSQRQVYKRYRRKDGGTLWGRATVSAIRNAAGDLEVLIAIVTDVTDQVVAERRVRFQAQLLGSVQESIVVTDLDGKITYWNHVAEELYGFSAEEALGNDITLIVPPDDYEEERRRMAHAREHGSWSGRYVLHRKDGSKFWADTSLSLVLEDSGEPSGIIGIDRDISELILREKDLRNLALRLQRIGEQDRTTIAREVHDEFGQVLTALKLDVAWLEGRNPTDEMEDRLGSMRELISQMLDAVRTLAYRLRPSALDDLGLESAIAWQAQDFSKRTGIECRCELQDPIGLPQNLDRDTALFRILQESLTNVVRHAEASNVDISLRRVEETVELVVTDDGRGIRQEELTGGESLGLLGMRERARALGGRIEFCENGGGTTVLVVLPA